MEVHHHPAAPHGEKKRFKEYFLEFLMIFLAVTMGFLAENLREHLSDSSKESKYISGLIKNLEVDTANLRLTIKANHEQIKGIDSLLNISKDRFAEIKVQDSLFLFSVKYLFNANDFKNDDITLAQLRNAGGYGLIRYNAVLDTIADYEGRIHNMDIQFNYLLSSLTKTLDDAKSVFDLSTVNKFLLNRSSTPVLITKDKEKVYAFFNQCWSHSITLKGYNQMLKHHLEYSTRFIAFLKKTYDVD
jgi:hypothetical protein